MERRKFLIGAGALASGSAAAVGTGAFSSVDANRDFDLDIEGDQNAYLQLDPTSEYASVTEGSIELDFGFTTDDGGSGINGRADTSFDDVFTIKNQGTETVNVWVATQNPTGSAEESVEFVADTNVPDTDDIDGSSPVDISGVPGSGPGQSPVRSTTSANQGGFVVLEPGDSVDIDVNFFVAGDAKDRSTRLFEKVYQFRANVNQPDGESDYTDSSLAGD
jgi:hypothetical protein